MENIKTKKYFKILIKTIIVSQWCTKITLIQLENIVTILQYYYNIYFLGERKEHNIFQKHEKINLTDTNHLNGNEFIYLFFIEMSI